METPAHNVVLSYLQRVPLEERVEMARALTETVNSPGWKVYVDLLTVRIDTARMLTEGWQGVQEYPEMVAQSATLRGLLTAQSIPAAVFEAGDRADEELRRIVAAREADT